MSDDGIPGMRRLESRLEYLASDFTAHYNYLDLEKFYSALQQLEAIMLEAEAAQDANTCEECGELNEDCCCEDEEDEDEDDEATGT